MKLGNCKKFILLQIVIFLIFKISLAETKIETVPLINLEDLSPTFEEDKDELEKIDEKNSLLEKNNNTTNALKTPKKGKIYINLTALDKITAKTSSLKMEVGEIKKFGSLEIKALKCKLYEKKDILDSVAYLQVRDLSVKDNNQVFLFNGWTFASSPTLRSIDHPIYDLWITGCEIV